MKLILINRESHWLEIEIERTYYLEDGYEWLNITIEYKYNVKRDFNYTGDRELIFRSGPSEWIDLGEMIILREALEKFIKNENTDSGYISFLEPDLAFDIKNGESVKMKIGLFNVEEGEYISIPIYDEEVKNFITYLGYVENKEITKEVQELIKKKLIYLKTV